MCLNTRPCEQPATEGVWWRHDKEWKLDDAITAGAIRKGLAEGAESVYLGNIVSLKHGGSVKYVADLRSMKQINMKSSFERDIKVVKAPSSEEIVKDDALRACQKSIRSTKKMIQKLKSDLEVKLELLQYKLAAAEIMIGKQLGAKLGRNLSGDTLFKIEIPFDCSDTDEDC